MPRLFLVLIGSAWLAAGCSDRALPPLPTNPAPPASASVAGTWTGTASDSSGTMMGSGFIGSGAVTWQLNQNGNQVTGTMSMGGVTMMMSPTVTGTISGSTMTFQVAMPTGSMPAPMLSCSDSANGTMTVNAAGNVMTGTFAGTNSCNGPFANGQMTMNRQ